MHKTQFMKATQTPGKLDGDIEHSLKRLLQTAFIEPARVNPILETASLYILGEDQDLVTHGPEEAARDQVRVFWKVYPRL